MCLLAFMKAYLYFANVSPTILSKALTDPGTSITIFTALPELGQHTLYFRQSHVVQSGIGHLYFIGQLHSMQYYQMSDLAEWLENFCHYCE